MTQRLKSWQCDKSFSGATIIFHQQNPCVTSGINSLLYVPIRKVLLNFLQYQLFLSLTVLAVTILFIAKLFLIVLAIF